MSTLFSVIIPTYNRAVRLRKALDSLVSQTFRNFEVIICDDGSVDGTKEMVEKFNSRLNLKYIWNENWGGPARPRNLGIEKSTGEWLCFLDSDDWWYPSKLEECAKYLDGYDFLYHTVDIFNAKKNCLAGKKVGRRLGVDAFRDLILNGNGIANSSVLIRKTICFEVGDISENKSLVAVEDYDYWLRVTKHTSKIKLINQALGAYYWDGDSNISQISMDRINKEITIFEKYLPYLNSFQQRQAIHVFSHKIGRYYGVLGDFSKARKNLFSSIKSNNIALKLKSIFFFLKYSLK